MSVLRKKLGPRRCLFTLSTPLQVWPLFLIQKHPETKQACLSTQPSLGRLHQGDTDMGFLHPTGDRRGQGRTRMLLRLTSSSVGSLLFIRSSVSSTSVEFGSSSGTGLYCVGLITPRVTHKREMAHRNRDHFLSTRGLSGRKWQQSSGTWEEGLSPAWTWSLSCKNWANSLLCVLVCRM